MINNFTVLTRKERKELKIIINNYKYDPKIGLRTNVNTLEDLNYYQKELHKSNLIELKNYGEISNSKNYDNLAFIVDDRNIYLIPSDKGLHYFENYHEYLIINLFKSFITPIVVSVVTTLITIGVQQLLQLILK